jgi:hypothetical protein
MPRLRDGFAKNPVARIPAYLVGLPSYERGVVRGQEIRLRGLAFNMRRSAVLSGLREGPDESPIRYLDRGNRGDGAAPSRKSQDVPITVEAFSAQALEAPH